MRSETTGATNTAPADRSTGQVWVGLPGERGRVVTELLRLQGFTVHGPFDVGPAPLFAVVDPATAAAVLARHPGAPLVLDGVSGPSAVMGRLARARILRYVPRGTGELDLARTAGGVGDALLRATARIERRTA